MRRAPSSRASPQPTRPPAASGAHAPARGCPVGPGGPRRLGADARLLHGRCCMARAPVLPEDADGRRRCRRRGHAGSSSRRRRRGCACSRACCWTRKTPSWSRPARSRTRTLTLTLHGAGASRVMHADTPVSTCTRMQHVHVYAHCACLCMCMCMCMYAWTPSSNRLAARASLT